MSILLFVDESRWESPGKPDYYATMSGIAVEELSYVDFCRRLMKLKGRFFKRPGIDEYALQGRALLCNRALTSYRKVEFVQELFSLCRLQKVVAFSTTRKCLPSRDERTPSELPTAFPMAAISPTDKYSGEVCSILLAYLVERVNTFMLERHPGQVAKIIFKTEEANHDRLLSSCLMNFIFKTSFGSGFHGILGTPFFAPASHSPGLQLADLFAYIINQHHGGRKEMRDFFEEVLTMQFISSIEQDEFELRGMNLIE
ncbi:MAG: DUF3800 domain-containing protein [bacterium]|nr:DUF3800 domain-containing protein [bacterium]